MNLTWDKVIITVIIVGIALLAQRISLASIKKVVLTRQLKPSRGKFVHKIFDLLNFIIVIVLIVSIWGC